ncbi:hypothetical protein PoB_001402200 [Plakobranchus ocellatus]|uniref:Uncharacterized protein n=1 Tax=Plakobranchus ocellatus TaxID=259542 RepID=A0AAV3YZ86_9GAST|nr:hypothetical protein PoB_001402200 [Plakobranchus ocellatus]
MGASIVPKSMVAEISDERVYSGGHSFMSFYEYIRGMAAVVGNMVSSFSSYKQRATIKHGLPDLTVTRIISLENLRRRETTQVLRATVTYSPNYPTDITPSPHFRTAALAGGCVYSPVITLSRITLTIEPTQTMPASATSRPLPPPTTAPFHGQSCRSGHVHASGTSVYFTLPLSPSNRSRRWRLAHH